MKTERRHELQHNVLADKVAHWIEIAEPHARTILLATVGALALLFIYLYMSAQQQQRLAEGWDNYFQAFQAQDVKKLSATAESFPRTPVADWSRLMAADLLLDQNIGGLFTDRAAAREELRRAADMYQTVRNYTDDKSIIERATYGLARAHESLGDLEKAAKEYNAVATSNGPFANLAAERRDDLKRAETKELYDWLAKYQPPGANDRPDKKPDFMTESLEKSSALQLPGSITDKIPATPSDDLPKTTPATPENEKPASETPAGETKPDATPKPDAEAKPDATAKPDAEKPAAEAKPDGEKPAESKPNVEKPSGEAGK